MGSNSNFLIYCGSFLYAMSLCLYPPLVEFRGVGESRGMLCVTCLGLQNFMILFHSFTYYYYINSYYLFRLCFQHICNASTATICSRCIFFCRHTEEVTIPKDGLHHCGRHCSIFEYGQQATNIL